MSFYKSIKSTLGLEIEKPQYEIIKKIGDDIEIRKYLPTKWVCTSVEGEEDHLKSDYQRPMFFKLFNYISGENREKEKIPMTAPVTVIHNNTKDEKIEPKSQCKMTMGFFVPVEKQNHTPDPTNPDTFIKSEPELIVATIKFGGYASTDDYINNRDLLIKALGEEAKEYDVINFITAGYDPPFKPVYRTNEVWLKKIN